MAVDDNCLHVLEWARNTLALFFQCDFIKALCFGVFAEVLKIQRWNVTGAASRILS